MNDHDVLMNRLRTIAARVDGPPDMVGEAARAALSMRRLEGELAELMLDTPAEAGQVRGDERIRLLAFHTDTASLELQVHEIDGAVTLRGLVTGASGEVVVQTPRDQRTAPIDAGGWFTVDGLLQGMVRLRVRADDGTVVTTRWVSV
jgi:hypothetical protein